MTYELKFQLHIKARNTKVEEARLMTYKQCDIY